MQQALTSLVINAAEAVNPDGGKILLSTGMDASAAGSPVYFEVTDNGCGVTPERQLRAFDPFFTTKGKGRGLGLAVTRGIVQAHAGQIHLTSTPPSGTTVRVFLQAAGGYLSPSRAANGKAYVPGA
jgi:signal transduction histidine kinase